MFLVTLQPVTTTMQDNQIRVFLSIPQVWVNAMGSRGLIGLFITTGLVELFSTIIGIVPHRTSVASRIDNETAQR